MEKETTCQGQEDCEIWMSTPEKWKRYALIFSAAFFGACTNILILQIGLTFNNIDLINFSPVIGAGITTSCFMFSDFVGNTVKLAIGEKDDHNNNSSR